MQMEACTTTEEKPFANSQRVFDNLAARLASADVLRMMHGDS